MFVVFILVLLLFGGKKMPELARGLGKSIRDFKRAASGVENQIKRAIDEAAPPEPRRDWRPKNTSLPPMKSKNTPAKPGPVKNVTGEPVQGTSAKPVKSTPAEPIKSTPADSATIKDAPKDSLS